MNPHTIPAVPGTASTAWPNPFERRRRARRYGMRCLHCGARIERSGYWFTHSATGDNLCYPEVR